MKPRPLMIASMLGASIGVPYFASRSPSGDKPAASQSTMTASASPFAAARRHRRRPRPRPLPAAYRRPGIVDIRQPRAARRRTRALRRSSAAVRRDERLGVSQLGPQIDRPDGRRPVRGARAAGDGNANELAGRFADVLLQHARPGRTHFVSRPHGRHDAAGAIFSRARTSFSRVERRWASRSTK